MVKNEMKRIIYILVCLLVLMCISCSTTDYSSLFRDYNPETLEQRLTRENEIYEEFYKRHDQLYMRSKNGSISSKQIESMQKIYETIVEMRKREGKSITSNRIDDIMSEYYSNDLLERVVKREQKEKRRKEVREFIRTFYYCKDIGYGRDNYDRYTIALDNIIYVFTTDLKIGEKKLEKPFKENNMDIETFKEYTFEGYVNGIVDELINTEKTLDEIKSELNSTIIRDYFSLAKDTNKNFYYTPENYLLVKIDMNNNAISYTAKINGEYVSKLPEEKFSFKFTGPRDILVENDEISMVEGFLSKNGENELKSKFFMVSQDDDFVYDLNHFLENGGIGLEVFYKTLKLSFYLSPQKELIENTAKEFLSSYGNQPEVKRSDFDKWQYAKIEIDGIHDFLIGKYPVTLYEYRKFAKVPIQAKYSADGGYESNRYTHANFDNNELCPVFPCQITAVENNNYNSAFDIAMYCNKKSIDEGLKPYYDIVSYGVFQVRVNEKANGYRLPTEEELRLAKYTPIKKYKYSGSNYLFEVKPSDELHTIVGSKKPNEYGLYDMERDTLISPPAYIINNSRDGFLLTYSNYPGCALRLVRNI